MTRTLKSRRLYHRLYKRKWREKHREHYNALARAQYASMPTKTKKEKAFAYRLKRHYGITPEQYAELFQKQGGCCAVCRRPAKMFATRLAVDHDHKSGLIRGLLCTHCNREIIGRQTNPEIFYAAAKYLAQNTGWLVPKPPKKKRKRKK